MVLQVASHSSILYIEISVLSALETHLIHRNTESHNSIVTLFMVVCTCSWLVSFPDPQYGSGHETSTWLAWSE